MPVQIGKKVHSFNNPTGLLSDCHRRMEMFMRSLEAVAKVIDSVPDEETRRALEAALKYFREAAPKHTADEEESLFPRLPRLRSDAVEEALSQVDELEQEHRWAEPLHAQVESLGLEYLSQGRPLPSSPRCTIGILLLRTRCSSQSRRALSHKPEKEAIAGEMASRRTAPPVKVG